MLTIGPVDTSSRAQVRRFVRLPYQLYAHHPQWVPPLLADAERQLDRKRHPFYEHSDAEFFLAEREGRAVGRIAVLEHRPFNSYHGTRRARFFLFECEDDRETATALFERVDAWAAERGLNEVVGPQGFSTFDGYGMLVEGFEHRQMMTMASYNYPYYPGLVEALGFEKEVDFSSWHVSADTFLMPPRVSPIAERVRRRGKLQVRRFRSIRDLRAWAAGIGAAYNSAFCHNWEYAPLTQREIAVVVDTLTLVADPRLIAVITHGADVVGFLLAFPDVSSVLQRARGHLWPWTILDLLRERRRARWVSLNGMGILPAFQGQGGNALLYAEIEHILRERGFSHGEITQVAETAVQMRRDLEQVCAVPYKRHRVYIRAVK